MDLLNQKLFGGAILELQVPPLFLPGKCVPGRKKWNLVSLLSVKGESCAQRVILPSALGGANQPLEGCLSLQTLQGEEPRPKSHF